MGFPVRVIATSDIDLCCSAFRATWADDRTAVGRGAILAKSGLATRCSMGRRPVVGGVGDGEGLSCRESAAVDFRAPIQSNQTPPIPKHCAGRATLGPPLVAATSDEHPDDVSHVVGPLSGGPMLELGALWRSAGPWVGGTM